jgi:hypothetical protein
VPGSLRPTVEGVNVGGAAQALNRLLALGMRVPPHRPGPLPLATCPGPGLGLAGIPAGVSLTHL